MPDLPLPFEPTALTHLRLAAATNPEPRRPTSPGRGATTAYPDRARHAADLGRQVNGLVAAHGRRVQTLGVEPELVLVLETNRPLDPDEVERAGLTVLEIRSDRAMIAFAADPELTEFVRRNSEYRLGSPGETEKGNERQAAYQGLFDRIEVLRGIESQDLVGSELQALRTSGQASDPVVRLEVHCWCPENPEEARRRNQQVQAAIQTADGTVLSASVRAIAGWSVICCDMRLRSAEQLLSVDRVSWVELMPSPVLALPEFLKTTPDSLPVVVGPAPDAPILAVIDSGIRSAHPLLASAVVGVERVGEGLGDGGDESGHGTLVASIGLYGSLEMILASGQPATAAGRLLSVRVLDSADRFPDTEAWPELLLRAMEVAAEAGARVINVSIGDNRRPYVSPRPTAVAALVDQFIRVHPDVVVVTCAGNFAVSDHDFESLLSSRYVTEMTQYPDPGILDPGTAALALTVGGLGNERYMGVLGQQSAEKVVAGGPNLPSPHTRVGPGPMGAIKPELAAPAGSLVLDTLLRRPLTTDRLGSVVGAGGSQPDRLLAVGSGTSYAAPVVSHAALSIFARYPSLTGNSVRALLLAGAEELDQYLAGGAPARKEERQLTGYGRVSVARSAASHDHHVVLLSENSLQLNQVHFYRVPVPSSFHTPGGHIGVSVALAYDPPVRVTRLDYLASRMGFQLFYGPSLAEVRSAYIRAESDQEVQADADMSPSDLAGKLTLLPSDRDRGRGANQLGRYSRHQKLPDGPDEFILAVRNVNRWDAPGIQQPYSVAVLLERDPGRPGMYAELRAELEPLIEVEVDIEAEIEN